MSENIHIYSPYKDMAYPERHGHGCFALIMWAAAIALILLAIYGSK